MTPQQGTYLERDRAWRYLKIRTILFPITVVLVLSILITGHGRTSAVLVWVPVVGLVMIAVGLAIGWQRELKERRQRAPR